MSKKLLLIFLIFNCTFLICTYNVHAQSWLWAKQGINPGKKSWLTGETSIAMDKFHNVYETGKYDGDTVMFGSDILFGQPYETYLVKYDENGNVLWARSSQTNKNNANTWCVSEFVAVDSRGNVYITGQYEDTINFGTFVLTAPKNFPHAFLVKYDANGNVKWAKQSNTPFGFGETLGFSIAIDNSDNLYLTGYYYTSVSFSKDTLIGTGNGNVFLVRYDTNGNAIWAKQGINAMTGYSRGQSVITDNMGYVYLTGYFEDTITFGTQMLICPSKNQSNLFLVKYDLSGNVIWVKQPSLPVGGSSSSYGDALGKDNSGNIYVTGYFLDTVSFGAYTLINSLSHYHSSSSLFWAKYNTSGNLIYAKQGYNSDTLQWQGWSITTDSKNNLYLSGSGAGVGTDKAKIIFGSDTLQSKVKYGAVWLKFDSTGNVLNSYLLKDGGDGPQDPIAVDSSGCYVYWGGTTGDTVVVFNNDTIGAYFNTGRPFIARWNDGECGPLGINQTEKTQTPLILYPNPNNGNFTIRMNTNLSQEKEPEQVEIYNMLGEKIYQSALKTSTSQIKINPQAIGMYLYRVIDQDGKVIGSGKFSIE